MSEKKFEYNPVWLVEWSLESDPGEDEWSSSEAAQYAWEDIIDAVKHRRRPEETLSMLIVTHLPTGEVRHWDMWDPDNPVEIV